MTHLIDDTMRIPGGLGDLEAFDELARERRARAEAEQTASDLAELIARETARTADARREIADLQALLAVQSQRCDRLERELAQAGFYQREDVMPSSRWQALKQAVRGPAA
jgi:hypothetical protein